MGRFKKKKEFDLLTKRKYKNILRKKQKDRPQNYNRQIDRRMQTNIQINTKTDKQKVRQIDRQADKRT